MDGRADTTARDDAAKQKAIKKGVVHYVASAVFIVVLVLVVVLTAVLLNKKKTTTTTTTTTRTTPRLPTTLELLQTAVGANTTVTLSPVTNWSGTAGGRAVYVARPSSLAALQRLLAAARRAGLHTRAVGSAYSYSDLLADAGQLLVKTDGLTVDDRNPPVWLNEETGTVTAMAGLTMKVLSEFLVAKRVQLPSLPSTMNSLVAGVIGTASHGGNSRSGSISDSVVAVRLVDSFGDVRSYNALQHPNMMAVLRCCVGMCGVYYDVTFAVEPLETVGVIHQFVSSSSVWRHLETLRELVDGDGVTIHFTPLTSFTNAEWQAYKETGETPQTYDPWNDNLWIRKYVNASVAPLIASPGRRKRSVSLMDSSSHVLSPRFARSIDDSKPRISLFRHKTAYEAVRGYVVYEQPTQPRCTADVNMDGDLLDPHTAIGFIVPEYDDLNNTRIANDIIYDILRAYVRGGGMPLLTVMWRWNAPSAHCYLCPSFGNTTAPRVAHVELVGDPNEPTFDGFVVKVYERLLDQFGADLKFHWAKYDSALPSMSHQLRRAFAADMRTFARLRAQSRIDPEDLFVTQSLREIFTV